jgi:two-component sensor histidine kinase
MPFAPFTEFLPGGRSLTRAEFQGPEIGAHLATAFLRELNHRIRNDLQGLIGWTEIELRRASSTETAIVLEYLQGRLLSIAGIYDLLHADAPGVIDLNDYLPRLCIRIRTSRDLDRRRIALATDIASVQTSLDRAIIVGMIVNELTTNAIKHAFEPDAGGQISICLQVVQGQPELVVSDDGRKQITVDGQGQGLHLIRRLVAQLGGSITCEQTNGALWRVTFKSG